MCVCVCVYIYMFIKPAGERHGSSGQERRRQPSSVSAFHRIRTPMQELGLAYFMTSLACA